MKYILLVRHAKSSWDNLRLPDHDRPLNERGKRDAPRMGKRLKERGVHPDVMITSTAVRAIETCQAMASVLGFDAARIRVSRALYHADENELLQAVRSLKDTRDDEEVVMLFGHNPGLTEFANLLFTLTIANIPTTGIVGGRLLVNRWQDTEFGDGQLDFFDYPKSRKD